MSRCAWAKSELAIPSHDREWGVPVHDDRVLFEFLILETALAMSVVGVALTGGIWWLTQRGYGAD